MNKIIASDNMKLELWEHKLPKPAFTNGLIYGVFRV